MKTYKNWLLITAILLLAFGLRLYQLTEIPPGLTHDEANHGREAIGILRGVVLFFFPLNYGSEPLYSYTAAASMWLFGQTLFALRLVNVLFSVATIGLTFLWVRRRFNHTTALITAVLLAISFWPLASAREALRAGMLPFFMGTAVWFFWQMLDSRDSNTPKRRWGLAAAFGISVAITLHIYLAARVAWLIFPLFLIYLAWRQRKLFQKSWLLVLAGLLLAGVLVTPMFIYLANNPYALTRLDMLDGVLQEIGSGNFAPLWQNGRSALLAFIWPGFGDQFLAYNIPGRPVFDAISTFFFVLGLIVCLWRWKRPSYAFILLWFGVGILPSLITGPTANTTRNLAALAPTFILPAIGFTTAVHNLPEVPNLREVAKLAIATIWLLFAGWQATTDYFITWAQSPDVRSAYQHNLVKTLAYLNDSGSDEPAVLSTIYPGPAHDPSISLLLSDDETPKRWVDARLAIIAPFGQSSQMIIPASTPPHPLFAQWLQPRQTISLRPDDLDPSFTDYWLDASQLQDWSEQPAVANFNNALTLHHAEWLQTNVAPGETAELLLVWRVTDPEQVGPIVPPAFTSDVVIFSQLLNEAGTPFAQRDSLEAPSWDWQTGDLIAQIHPIPIPAETAAGSYQAIVGIYDRLSGERLPVLAADGTVVGDFTAVSPLTIDD
jgi:4-amino-4-deoxy-L-arabinose transferase-like glycosyltransferase